MKKTDRRVKKTEKALAEAHAVIATHKLLNSDHGRRSA